MKHVLLASLLALVSVQAWADTRQSVWNPGADTGSGIEGCSDGSCSLNRGEAARIQNVAMFGDGFVQVDKATPAYAPIGVLINHDDGTMGTAYLISPCYVQTTRHKVIDNDSLKPGNDFSFLVGASSTATFKSEINATLVEYGNDSSTKEDFAVLNLDRCVGNQYGYVKILDWEMDMILQIPKHNVAIRTAGYPRTESLDKISVVEQCSVPAMHPLDPGALAVDCSAVGGSSGSPVFIEK